MAPDGDPAVQGTEAFLLPLAGGGRFCLFHPASGTSGAGGAVVYVHPFGEEMNKSRRMAALQAREFSEAGIAVLQIDLFGCGDSAGDFGDAAWPVWVSDVVAAVGWLRARTGLAPSIWGLRAGCLLAVTAAAELDPTPDLVLWQPVLSGRQHLQQFLRLRVASQLIGRATDDRIGTTDLRGQLERGMTIDVAGYALAPAVALGLAAADLAPLSAPARVAWFEVAVSDPPQISPAGCLRIEAWQAAGHHVAAKAVVGLPFWQTQEIAECPTLVGATLATVLGFRE